MLQKLLWVAVNKTAPGRLVYYAAKHQKLVGIARASGNPSSVEGVVPVQVLLAIPTVPLGAKCDWEALGLRPSAIKGHRAIHLTHAAYTRAWEAIVARTEPLEVSRSSTA